MKKRISSQALCVVAGFLLAGIDAETKSSNIAIAPQPQQQLQFNSYYTCNGERLAVIRCASDADDAYCSVQYPDRKGPATRGLTPELVEKRGDVIKKLQACGALPSSRPSAQPSDPKTEVAGAQLSLGDKYREEKNYAKAIWHYKQAITLRPSLWKAHLGLGWSYFNQEQWDLALAPLKQARALKPENLDTLSLLGACHEIVARSAAAKAALTQTDLKHYADALEAYREVLKLTARAGPSTEAKYYAVPGWYSTGLIHNRLGQYEKAVPALREALRIMQTLPVKSHHAEAYHELGQAYNELEKYPEAIDAYKKAIAINPSMSRAHSGLGRAYYNVDRYVEAVAACEHAIRLKSDDALTYYFLGAAYSYLNKKQDALRAHRALQNLDKTMAQQLYTDFIRTMK